MEGVFVMSVSEDPSAFITHTSGTKAPSSRGTLPGRARASLLESGDQTAWMYDPGAVRIGWVPDPSASARIRVVEEPCPSPGLVVLSTSSSLPSGDQLSR